MGRTKMEIGVFKKTRGGLKKQEGVMLGKTGYFVAASHTPLKEDFGQGKRRPQKLLGGRMVDVGIHHTLFKGSFIEQDDIDSLGQPIVQHQVYRIWAPRNFPYHGELANKAMTTLNSVGW